MDPQLRRIRGHLISVAVLLVGIVLSAIFFFLNWALGDAFPWVSWLMPLSYAAFLGSALIAVLIQLYLRYKLPRGRILGTALIILWVAASLLSTALDTLTVSQNMALGISGMVVIVGFVLLVIPGFLLILFPPRFLERQGGPRDEKN